MEHFADSILAGSKANNRFPGAEGVAADRSSRMEDMFGSASDAWVASNRAGADHSGTAAAVLDRHLLFANNTKEREREREKKK